MPAKLPKLCPNVVALLFIGAIALIAALGVLFGPEAARPKMAEIAAGAIAALCMAYRQQSPPEKP